MSSLSLLKSTNSIARIAIKSSNKSFIRCLSNSLLHTSFRSNLEIIRKNQFNLLNKSNNIKIRKFSVIENESAAPTIDYNIMKEIANSNDKKYVIVDVREPDEFNAGHIPNAINIPCKSSPGALGLDPEEFKLTFGFDKPSTEKTLVFYCLAGVRARMSEELAGTFGYNSRLTYAGSFKDWLENNGKIEVPEKSTTDTTEKK